MWWLLLSAGVSFVVSLATYALLPRREQFTSPAGIGDFSLPTAEEGREIPVLFGTRDQEGANVVWYGDLKVDKIGGDLPGHFYSLGAHLVLCHGPIDGVSGIDFDGLPAWRGFAPYRQGYSNFPVTINAGTLFGGRTEDGGVSGRVDFLFGGDNQAPTPYMQKHLDGADTPGFRGVVSAVFNQLYIGTNPRLAPVSFRVQRVALRQNGIPQWYVERAAITDLAPNEERTVFILFDVSVHMDSPIRNTPYTRRTYVYEGIKRALDYLASSPTTSQRTRIYLVGFGGPLVNSLYTKTDTANNADALKAWIDQNADAFLSGANYASAMHYVRQTVFDENLSNVRVYFISNGIPRESINETGNPREIANAAVTARNSLLAGDPKATVRGIRIDRATDPKDPDSRNTGFRSDTNWIGWLDTTGEEILKLDGTSADDLAQAIVSDLLHETHSDMNPVHIIRECLTDPVWGMGYAETDIDDQSFAQAAHVLFDESFGISLIWDKQLTIENFIQEILKYIDAALYVDRETGRFKVKLIRGDYAQSELPTLGVDQIVKVDNVSRPSYGELVNTVTVNFWDAKTGKTSTVTAHDTALIQSFGSVVSKTVEYPGITNETLALNVAQRDLRILSSMQLSCTVHCDRSAFAFNVGDVFRLVWPDISDQALVMRVTAINLGDSRSNTIKISATEDVFSYPVVSTVHPIPPPPPAEVPPPIQIVVIPTKVINVPWGLTATQKGSSWALRATQGNPDMSQIMTIVGHTQEYTLRGIVAKGEELGYVSVTSFEGSSNALTALPINALQTEVEITDAVIVGDVREGSLALLGDEFVRVDSIKDNIVMLGRGVLDTPATEHAEGARLFFLDQNFGVVPSEHSAGEKLGIKVEAVAATTRVGMGAAEAIEHTFEARASKPYPPGYVQIALEDNGPFHPFVSRIRPISSNFWIKWNHRNRFEIRDELVDVWDPYTFSRENGVTYTVRITYPDTPGTFPITVPDCIDSLGVWVPPDIQDDHRIVMEIRAVLGDLESLPLVHTVTIGDPLPSEIAASLLQKVAHWWPMHDPPGLVVSDAHGDQALRVEDFGTPGEIVFQAPSLLSDFRLPPYGFSLDITDYGYLYSNLVDKSIVNGSFTIAGWLQLAENVYESMIFAELDASFNANIYVTYVGNSHVELVLFTEYDIIVHTVQTDFIVPGVPAFVAFVVDAQENRLKVYGRNPTQPFLMVADLPLSAYPIVPALDTDLSWRVGGVPEWGYAGALAVQEIAFYRDALTEQETELLSQAYLYLELVTLANS